MTLERRLKVLPGRRPPGDLGNSLGQDRIRVAFATSDMKRVDQHFGAAAAFAIHEIDLDRHALIEVVQFGPLDKDGNEDKLSAKIAALEGCVAVYCEAVGASAVHQLRGRGIQPLKVAPATSLNELIRQLQMQLREGPSPWLALAMAGTRPDHAHRFDRMESEGWCE